MKVYLFQVQRVLFELVIILLWRQTTRFLAKLHVLWLNPSCWHSVTYLTFVRIGRQRRGLLGISQVFSLMGTRYLHWLMRPSRRARLPIQQGNTLRCDRCLNTVTRERLLGVRDMHYSSPIKITSPTLRSSEASSARVPTTCISRLVVGKPSKCPAAKFPLSCQK